MLKKLYILIMIVFALSAFGGCSKETSNNPEEVIPPWVGQYVMLNEKTEEFKVLTIDHATEEEVVFSFKSVRGEDEFTGILKTKSKKYAVCNAGDRCLKFDLKSSSTLVRVDDIWTNSENVRNENWSGKYRRLEEFEEIEDFGDPSWNGRYTGEENGLSIEVYGIKEGLALLSLKNPESGEKYEFSCIVDEEAKNKAVYSDEIRTIEIELVKNNKIVEITETVNEEALTEEIIAEETMPAISGRYTR